MGLYLRDSATSDMIAVNQLLKKAKENSNEILSPEKGRTASYEEQPKLQVRLKSGMD
ncbi:hypothetical protein [Leptospira noguchii]|uniref:hypothetical protein n=1 Tax=Leptospira noguchii TaxID=28182 RepID=UPI001FB6698D|nr:hypothetical protein [Leptospira noguchii]UOG31837.1 hypothetical protein MAL06_07560 [Leptospira noguchii]